jgi:hypothetical protein
MDSEPSCLVLSYFSFALPKSTFHENIFQALKAGVFSNAQSTQSLPSTSIPPGPPLPQQLAHHPYSQPTLPITAVFRSKIWIAKIHCSISFVFGNNCPIID